MASKKQTTQETPIKCNDIFKPLPGQDKPIRTVLTKGIAGIGKTVSVQKFLLDWAEGKANQDVHFMFPLPFRDLNLKKDQYSLMQLLSHYFPELKEIDSIEDGETKTVFIFDGLDECRLPLDFKNNEKCCDVTKPTSVDVLLTNLIEGNLLPSALLWITTRPAAANQIPPVCVDQVTEVRGFNDPQKEEYFRKKIPDQNLANEIIKHMKTSRSLHIMCHMPVFCWISATVLEMMLKEAENDEVPKTLTQMYSHFILIQIIVKNRKYNTSTETNPKDLSQSDKEMILKLAKLAFQQLQKGNLIFYEEDLRECGLDVTEASEYSALCTEIFKEESGLYQEKVYSFVHLSIQEFLAALHVLESCLDKKENVFSPTSDEEKESIQLSDLHRRAVDQALKSENGHLDLFLRFLLGLSLESNQHLLRGLLTQTGSTTQNNKETVERTVRYLSDKIEEESSPERIINLFHCLNELGANSLVEDMQTSLRSGTLSGTRLKPDQCSALAYLFLMSEEVLEEFDLKTYNTSEEGYQRLLPVVKTCKRALLDRCELTYKSGIPQSCKTCDHVEDSTHWIQIEPLTSTVQGVTMFRHRTPKGSYECTVSGLRWLCERDVILKYHFRNWDPYSQLLKDMQYTQGGPLLDITMELGELEEVHLPHFVCLGTNPSLRNEMKILHVESLEEVHEVTRFHAKILHPKFSPIGPILRLLSWDVDVHCELMLYLTVKRETLISRLYLFPWNPSQIQAVKQQEMSEGSKRILITNPEQSLKLNSSFRLNIPFSTAINPQVQFQ
uniref:NACHT domain-containing protein n=1 Tax=Salmo trutta TaxID=8032 RepID=A0A674BF63_SALTR